MLSRIGKRRASRVGLVVAGIVLGQLILYGASFAGQKILLPLDVLTLPGVYIPSQPGQSAIQPHNEYAADPVLEDEPARLFRNAELRAGRLPIWNPYQYAGVPTMSFLSPFAILGASVRSPRILPWVSLAAALISGFGAYVFARRVLKVSLWPATIAAWCYPITGFFVLWQSYSLAYPVVWLPWLLVATQSVLLGVNRLALSGLALTTMLTIVSGHVDISALVLAVSGLFAVWQLLFVFRDGEFRRESYRRGGALIAAWLIGIMLASPELLPALEYANTGSRLTKRESGQEERPPVGLVSLPQLVLPHIYGTEERNSFRLMPKTEGNVVETPAAGYCGLLATLAIAPLAFGSSRHRRMAVFSTVLAFVGMAWCLDVPFIVEVMRLPLLNVLSYNRFIFATGFGIISLSAIGVDAILTGEMRWRPIYYLFAGLVVVLAGWCIFRGFNLPAAIGVKLPQEIARGDNVRWVNEMTDVYRIQQWFVRMYFSGAIICFTTLGVWAWIKFSKNSSKIAAVLIGFLGFGELLFFDYGRAAQCDPRLYYPPLAALDKAARTPGRTLGYKCLPANLLQTQGCLDVRGYDGVDPARYVELLDLAAAPDTTRLPYAAVQCFAPEATDGLPRGSVRFSPILDLLGVRYLICMAPDPTGYFLLENRSALPRVFIPASIEVETDAKTRLAKLADASFDPRQVAYLEEPVQLAAPIQGEASIIDDTPQRIKVAVKMVQAGLVVLADQWNSGWRAYVNGKPVPILRVDHALRGVVAPGGESTIVFRYQPTSLRVGLLAATLALLILIVNTVLAHRRGMAKQVVK
jgi:hypothetical protein